MELDPAHTALLALHWERDVVSPEGALGPFFSPEIIRNDTLARMRSLLDAARAAGAVVAYTRISFAPGYPDLPPAPHFALFRDLGALVDGEPGAQIVDELAPQPGDLVCDTSRVCGFADTALDAELRARGVDTVLVTGVATNFTVYATAVAAGDLGYRVVVVADCTSARSPEVHAAALESLAVVAEVEPAAAVAGALTGVATGTPAPA